MRSITLGIQLAFQVALLGGGEFVIEDNDIAGGRGDCALQLFEFSAADEGGRVRLWPALQHLARHRSARAAGKLAQFLQRLLAGKLTAFVIHGKQAGGRGGVARHSRRRRHPARDLDPRMLLGFLDCGQSVIRRLSTPLGWRTIRELDSYEKGALPLALGRSRVT